MAIKSKIQSPKSKIAIVGAGPAGASLAIRLARVGFEVTLIERENFPRQKLCGEFISPECLDHFAELEVLDEMLAVGGDRITETVFYAPNGRYVSVPSKWFGNRQGALSISRAEMDFRLLEKARTVGVRVLEETSVTGVLFENDEVKGVQIKSADGQRQEIRADLTIDATGRTNVLTKLINKSKIQNPKSKIQNRFVGFKTHLENVHLEKGRCEIYFFEGGYGGLSFVERGRANHCFLIEAEKVKKTGSADALLENIIYKNRRAFETLRDARPVFDWLAVAVDGFGIKDLNPAKNLFTVGDAAAFIDPFTGSGMLMALQSSEVLFRAIDRKDSAFDETARFYESSYRQTFTRRLRICGFMRRAAFAPNLAKTLISVLSLSRPAQEFVARATRQNTAWRIKSEK